MGFGSSNSGFAAASSNLSPLAPPFSVDRLTSRSALNINAAPFETPYANWGNSHSQAHDYHPTSISETVTSSLFPNSDVYSVYPPAEPQTDHVVCSSTQFSTSLMTNGLGDGDYHASSSVWDNLAQNELGNNKSSSSLNSIGITQDNYTQSLYGLHYPTQWDISCDGRLDIESGGKNNFLDGIPSEALNCTNPPAYRNYFNEGTELSKDLSKPKSSGEYWAPQFNNNFRLQENPVISLGKNVVAVQPFPEFSAKETYASTISAIHSRTSGISMATTPDISVMDSWGNLMPHARTDVTVHEQLFSDHSPHWSYFHKVTTGQPSVVTSVTTSVSLPPQNNVLNSSNDMPGISDDIICDRLYSVRDPWVSQISKQGQEVKKYMDIRTSGIDTQRCDSNVMLFPTKYEEQSGVKNVTASGALNVFKHEVAEVHDKIQNLEGFNLLIDESDQYNPSEDSPCWKGSSSYFSPFQVSETIQSQHHLKSKNSSGGLNLNEPQTSLSCKIPKTVLSTDFREKSTRSTNGCQGEAETLLSYIDSGFMDSHLYDEPKSEASHVANKLGAAELNPANGFYFSNDNHRSAEADAVEIAPFRIKKPEPSNPIRLCLETMCSESEKENRAACMMSTDVKLNDNLEECQSYVPSNAAKQVLSSLSSDADIFSKHNQGNWDEYATESKSMLLKTIVNLSDSLLFYYLNDENPVGNDDHKTLELVLSKLTMCLKFTQEKSSAKEFPTGKQGTLNVSSKGQACVSVAQPEMTNKPLVTKAINQEDGPMMGSNFERLCKPVTADDTEEVGRMTKAIKEILDANFHEDNESPPSATIYKNLWLEAEALLCSTNYKARYLCMKNEMEKSGSHEEKEQTLDCKLSLLHTEVLRKSSGVDKSVHAAEIMERYNILKSRTETYDKGAGCELESSNISLDQRTTDKLSNQVTGHDAFIKDANTGCQSHDGSGTNVSGNLTTIANSTYPSDMTEDHVMSRLQVLKSRRDFSNYPEPEQQAAEPKMDCVGKRDCSPGLANPTNVRAEDGFEEAECASGSKIEYPKFAHTSQMVELGAQFSGGWYENTSSDWEHVLKDEFTWTG